MKPLTGKDSRSLYSSFVALFSFFFILEESNVQKILRPLLYFVREDLSNLCCLPWNILNRQFLDFQIFFLSCKIFSNQISMFGLKNLILYFWMN